jgi:BESS motif
MSSWVHYEGLKFLEKVLTKKKQLPKSHKTENNDNNNDVETIVIEPSDDDDESNSSYDNYNYIRQQQQEQKRMLLVNQRHQCCPHDAGDEVVHFFKSIAPYLAMMEPTMKLRVRIEIQEIILNELSRKIDAARGKIMPKRISKRVVKRNRKYL